MNSVSFFFFFCHRWKTPALLLLKSSTCFCVLLLFSNTGESCERCDVEVYMCALRCCFLSIFFFFFLLNIRFWHGFPYMYIKKCYPFLNCFFFFFFSYFARYVMKYGKTTENWHAARHLPHQFRFNGFFFYWRLLKPKQLGAMCVLLGNFLGVFPVFFLFFFFLSGLLQVHFSCFSFV